MGGKVATLFIFLFCTLFIGCFSDERTKNVSNNDIDNLCSGIKIAENEQQFIFKDFDIFKRENVPFDKNEKICYPFIKTIETKDSSYLFRVYYSNVVVTDFEMKKSGGFWVVNKATRNPEFTGSPNALNKIIIINDSTIIYISRLFKLSTDYYHVTAYTKYQKVLNSIEKTTYNTTKLTEKNVNDFSVWDSVTYRKHSFKPHFVTKLTINNNFNLESGTEFSLDKNSKIISKPYTRKWNHNINSSSFFFYLFGGW